jgi:uncharacterized membrane protein YoaK (UPF0700 family)
MSSLLLLTQISPPGDANLVTWGLSSFKWALEQFQQKNYLPLVSFVLMLAISLFQKFELTKINKKALPFVSAGLGVAISIVTNVSAMAMHSKPIDWISAIVMGLTVGAGATGLWEIVGQKLLGKPASDKPATDQSEK